MKVALVIGHTKKSQGASNKESGVSEFTFNLELASNIELLLLGSDIDVDIIYRDSYAELPGKINSLNPDLIISLHCNAFNTKASGTEVLYYHSSSKSKSYANILQAKLVEALGLADRGIKPKHSEGRGGYLLKETEAPCLIAEPFFIDNDADFKVAMSKYKELVMAYVSSVKEVFNVAG